MTQLTADEHKLVVGALDAMALRHNEWYKLESNSRNPNYDRMNHHVRMEVAYKNLREKLRDNAIHTTDPHAPIQAQIDLL